MDIDDYLKKKKELEKKKELLEAQQDLDEKKSRVKKKEVEIHRKREVTPVSKDPDDRPRKSSSRSPPHDNGMSMQWIFLGLAFFVALLVVGFFVVNNMMKDSSSTTEDSEVDALKEQIEELQEALEEDEALDETSEELDTSEDNDTGEVYTGPGPEVEIYLIDEHKASDALSLGKFDKKGMMGGNLIQLWVDGGEKGMYKYRLSVKNLESTRVQCKIDESIDIDEDQDGDTDETMYNLDLHVLELSPGEEDVIEDSIIAIGMVHGEYEARCYFCEDKDCDNVFYEGETKVKAKLKFLVNQQAFDANDSNSS